MLSKPWLAGGEGKEEDRITHEQSELIVALLRGGLRSSDPALIIRLITYKCSPKGGEGFCLCFERPELELCLPFYF